MLVTNRLEFVERHSETIIFVDKDGSLHPYNDISELSRQHPKFAVMLQGSQVESEAGEDDEKDGEEEHDEPEGEEGVVDDKGNQKDEGDTMKLVKEETRVTGGVSYATIARYYSQIYPGAGMIPLVILLLSYIVGELAKLTGSYWITGWSSNFFNKSINTPDYLFFYLGIFAAISVTQVLLIWVSQLFQVPDTTISCIYEDLCFSRIVYMYIYRMQC